MTEGYVVCARAEDALFASPDSTFDLKCSRCNGVVMITTTGRLFVKSHNVAILCSRCFSADETLHTAEIGTIDAPAEIQKKMDRAVPNPYLRRN
jgi:hypothetical protein